MALIRIKLSLAILALTIPLHAAADPTVPGPGAIPTAIPLAEVATRAAEVSGMLREIRAKLPAPAEVQTIEGRLPDMSRQIDLELDLTEEILRSQPALSTIAIQQKVWQERQLLIARWLSLLTARAMQFQDSLNLLGTLRTTWSDEAASAKASNAPAALTEQITAVLAEVREAEVSVQMARTGLLDLQSRVGREMARSERALAQIAQVQQRMMGGLLVRDTSPIWDATQWAEARVVLPSRIAETAARHWKDLAEYARDPSRGMRGTSGY